jgi:hypothetical protein
VVAGCGNGRDDEIATAEAITPNTGNAFLWQQALLAEAVGVVFVGLLYLGKPRQRPNPVGFAVAEGNPSPTSHKIERALVGIGFRNPKRHIERRFFLSAALAHCGKGGTAASVA